MRRDGGFSLVELLVAMTITLFVFVAVLGAYSQISSLEGKTQSNVTIQNNLRVAMDRVERDLRMIGFGVPEGAQIGGTAVWTPAIFHARSTEIGFRGEMDGGRAEIVCTPKTSNSDCPRTKLLLDSTAYYSALNCVSPAGGSLAVVAIKDGSAWEPTTCSAVNGSDQSITVAAVTNDTFTGGESEVVTLEQVYLRYTAQSQAPYGYLSRYVRYDNAPNSSFPPSPVSWTTVASHLTDFWLEYQDASGATLSGSALTATQRAAVTKVVVFMEGYDLQRPGKQPQLLQLRSEILIRNAQD